MVMYSPNMGVYLGNIARYTIVAGPGIFSNKRKCCSLGGLAVKGWYMSLIYHYKYIVPLLLWLSRKQKKNWFLIQWHCCLGIQLKCKVVENIAMQLAFSFVLERIYWQIPITFQFKQIRIGSHIYFAPPPSPELSSTLMDVWINS